MAYQTGSNVLVALKREATFGTAATATGTGQTRLRITDSPGLELRRAEILSNEKTSEAIRPMGRLGSKSVEGSYNVELSAGGGIDLLLEGLMRTAWATAADFAATDFTSFTVSTNQITAATSSFITAGIRVGDVLTLSNYSTSADNGKRSAVRAISTLALTFATGEFTGGSADTSCTLTRAKKLVNGATPTRTLNQFSVEQYDQDIDLSELFIGCRCVGVRLSMRPGEMATAEFTLMGVDRTALDNSGSPYFDSPTLTTSLALVADDSAISYNGKKIAKLTGIDVEFALTAAGEAVIGSLVMPDIFDNDLAVSGSVTGLREDFSNLTLFDAETEFELTVVLKEPSGTPPGFISIHLPRIKLSAISASVGGGDGAKIETANFMAARKASTTGYDTTVANFGSSGA